LLIRDDQWLRIEPMLHGKAGDRGRTGADNRLFVEIVLWMARTGAPWRDLPANFGPWIQSSDAFRAGLALGNPVRLILTAGQVADVTQGAALVEAIPTGAVIADKGYDCDALVDIIEASSAEAIIPPPSNRNTKRKVDWHRYRARNLVERFFNCLKQFRRITTQYDRLANRFNAFLHLACAYIWLL